MKFLNMILLFSWQPIYDFKASQSYLNLIPYGSDCEYRITVTTKLLNDGISHPGLAHIYPHKTVANGINGDASKYTLNLVFGEQDINEVFHITHPGSTGTIPDIIQEIQINIDNFSNSYFARWSGRELGVDERLGPNLYGPPLSLDPINPGELLAAVIEASCQ